MINLELNSRPTLQLKKPPRNALVNSMPLVQSVFLSPETHHAHGSIIAFTAADSRDSVTDITQSFAQQLAALTNKPVLIAEAGSLQCLRKEDCAEMPQSCTPTDNPNIWVLMDKADETNLSRVLNKRDEIDLLLNRSWEHNPDFGRDLLQELRHIFEFVLVDCRKLQEAAIIAPTVDGVVIVAAANRTRRGQIRHAQQSIEATGGKLLGFLLDGHRYPLPAWLYKRL